MGWGRVHGRVFIGSRRLHETSPMFEHVRRVPMDLEPRQRFAEWSAVDERAARPWRERGARQSMLKREDLTESLDVASRQRQHAE